MNTEEEGLRRLGAQIRHHRIAAGITQQEFADKAEITRTSVANIEAGRQNPPFGTLNRLATALDMELWALLTTDVSILPPARFDAERLYLRLNEAIEAQDMTWKQLAAQTQVSASTFSRMAVGLGPSLDNLARMLVWLGDTDIEPYISTDHPAA